MARRRMKQFLYLDESLVGQFLEQLEGGAYEEERVRTQENRTRGIGASGTIGPFSGKGERSRGGLDESEYTLKSTGASRYNRLHDVLTEEDTLQVLVGDDATVWDDLQRGELIEAEIDITIPDQVKNLAFAKEIEPLLSVVSLLSEIPNPDGSPTIDPQQLSTMKAQLPVITSVAENAEKAALPCLAAFLEQPKYKFFMRLDRDSLRVDMESLQGEATVVGKIHKKVAKGQPETIRDLVPGMPSAPRADRRKKGDPNTLVLRYPSAVLWPVAIFR